MKSNPILVAQRGVCKQNVEKIDSLREQITESIALWVKEPYSQERKDSIHKMEFLMQSLWGFPQDCGYHRYANEYEFKCQWADRTFRCADTGVEFTIPYDVQETDYFQIGNGAIDVGRLNFYSRVVGNIVEVGKEDKILSYIGRDGLIEKTNEGKESD